MECVNNKAGLGQGCETKIPLGVTVGAYLTKKGFTFPSMSALADRDTVLAAAAAGNIIIVQRIKQVTAEDGEGGTNETSIGKKSFSYEGNRGGLYETQQSFENHSYMRSLNGLEYGIIFVDINKAIICTEFDDGTVGGVELGYLHVLPLVTIVPETIVMTRFRIQEEENDDLDKNGKYFYPTWNPTRIYGPSQVQVANSVMAINAFTATVKYVNQNKTDKDGLPIESAIPGLVEAENWEVIDQNGDILTPTTDYTIVEQTTTGIYDVDATASGMTSGSIRVKASSTKMYASEETDVLDA